MTFSFQSIISTKNKKSYVPHKVSLKWVILSSFKYKLHVARKPGNHEMKVNAGLPKQPPFKFYY